MAGRGLGLSFKSIVDDYQAVAAEAIKKAATKAQEDIMEEAYDYLQKYYDSHKLRRYVRTNQLKNAIKPIFNDNSTSGTIDIEIGVRYDSNALRGAYSSNSWYHKSGTKWISRNSGDFDFDSQNNGIPQPEWILDNFLLGIHQWGDGPGEKEVRSDISTNTLMKEFFDVHLPKRIDEYMNTELLNAITSRL